MSHDTLRVRLLAFLFLIPLALYAWSAVQAFRVDSTLRDEQFMRDWSASVRNDPDAAGAIPRHLFRPAYGVEGHLHQFAEDAEAIRRDHPWLALRGWLAAIGKLCALASALVAAALLARLEYDGRRSMRSQAYLLGHLAPGGASVDWSRCTLACWSPPWPASCSTKRCGATATGTATASSPCSSRCRCGCCSSAACSCCGACAANCCRWRNRCSTCSAANSTGSPRPASGNGWDRSPTAPGAATGPCRHRHRALLLRHPGQGPAGTPRHSAGGAYPVHPADLCLGHERGRKRRDHRPRTRPLRRRRHRPRCIPVAPAAAGAPAHRTHRRPEDGHVGLLGKPGLWAALYFLDRFERAYLHWNRRQELAADKVGARVAGARVFAIALLRTCALAGLIERLLASPQTRNLVHALTDHLRGNSLELDEHDSARRLEHPSTVTRRPTSGSRTFPWRSTTICCDRQGASSAPTTRSGSTACSMQATGKPVIPPGAQTPCPPGQGATKPRSCGASSPASPTG